MTSRCHIVPPYLLHQIATAPQRGHAIDPQLVLISRETLQLDSTFRDIRSREGLRAPVAHVAAGGWTVYTAANGSTLPGTQVRDQAQTEDSGDPAADEAWAGVQATLAMWQEVYDRASYDGAGARVDATVHYQKNYDNAFWDGSQLVFGDGDGTIFQRFTKPVDVLGHEFTHAVTERTAGLVYQGQSGALNESVSDVFGSCLKQRLLGQTADQADWLIGAGLFVAGIKGVALRSMKAPGTAYDDPVLGKDPQPGDMSGYVDTTDDNGGVHTNSGIPNHAFQLAAVAIGGSSAEGAGRIWYAALQQVASDVDFAGFAAATVAAAGDQADAVRGAWEQVGVTPATASTGSTSGGSTSGGSTSGSTSGSSAGPTTGGGASVVEVRRTGGFAGRTVTGTLDLAAADPADERVREARTLVQGLDLKAAAPPGGPHPDGFVYDFTVDGEQLSLPEQHLTDDQRRLARLVLDV